ncbi:hypothetical protein B0I35DRAFT_451052 [Stachybotrys elegans]|uniref:Fibronectin type-III domain-containing protein n=1 Tax=Stachybotrys elegans TaxID=80388 RepID=A0A8K0SX43_9HYPO|nr:hypothetical protein B0I35DRAFT_451052 [Stachybotrys elegans]
MSWGLSTLIALVLSLIGFWWLFSSPQSTYHKAFYALVCALAILVDPHSLVQLMYRYPPDYITFADFRPHVFLTQHFTMVMTLGAVVWLLHRSWQTLWKPVPDLINILGVDVPESPDVCLAGIRADAATLSWSRPASNRPVQKYSIQVNGVHVGDSPGNEIAITVTGLKPNHFYNIRVVAVGPNNFQAGSPVIRLRTFGKDGKPNLGSSRLPTSFSEHDIPRIQHEEDSDDPDGPKQSIPSVEAAPVLDGSSAVRDMNPTVSGQRRNTVNRRHSPSVASMDQPPIRPPLPDGPELSLDELNRKFEAIRRETEDTLSLYAKDESDFLQQEDELKKEKERKRQCLKEKEEQTTQLKSLVRTTMEQMRAAEKERSKREQQLKDKDAKKNKVRDNIAKMEAEIERMKEERDNFESQKGALKDKRDRDVAALDEANMELQKSCAELEAELKDKGKQLQDLKEAREHLAGADDEQWKEHDALIKRDWEAKRRDLHEQLVAETKKGHQLDQHIRVLTEQLSIQHQSGLAYYGQAEAPQPPPPSDFDPAPTVQSKRLSHNSNSLSPPSQYAAVDSQYQSMGFDPGNGFPPALFMGVLNRQTEAEMRATSGPLSPTAHTLLPSGIFDETEVLDSRSTDSPYLPESVTAGEDDPQSPSSSSRSFSALSSPRDSSHNLSFPQYADTNDMRSAQLHSSPTAPPATGHRFTSLLSTFQRNRTPKWSEDDGGPPIGTLKPGQSQSFPRGTDENDFLPGSRRRLSFSWMNRNSADAHGVSGNFGPGSKTSSRLLPGFASSSSVFFADRDHHDSRPASIASSDLPRPSTDSGSIWGAPGDSIGPAKNRLWSPGDARWASRNVSRHASRHGSPSALTTTLASADDEILDEDDLLNPQTSPSQVGVIGSRPPGVSRAIGPRLNPTAPTFMGNGKDKERTRDRSKDVKGKGKEPVTPSLELPMHSDDSPSDSRMSRDTFSVHTQTSVSESHESLPLDTTISNTPSDINSAAAENVVRKLFRKGSSSKFSLSNRLGKDSSLFKKGPGSTANSDKNMSVDHRSSFGDLDDLGEDVSQDGRFVESAAHSPSLGPTKSKDGKDRGMTSWRFGMKKKGKEKESLEIERPSLEEE